ncbi:hypothetical protein G9A89_006298 [Geosiphon pyriformis]|nr:hypothetical protein G9A89_006298 [Geosiphon pyriformis]
MVMRPAFVRDKIVNDSERLEPCATVGCRLLPHNNILLDTQMSRFIFGLAYLGSWLEACSRMVMRPAFVRDKIVNDSERLEPCATVGCRLLPHNNICWILKCLGLFLDRRIWVQGLRLCSRMVMRPAFVRDKIVNG